MHAKSAIVHWSLPKSCGAARPQRKDLCRRYALRQGDGETVSCEWGLYSVVKALWQEGRCCAEATKVTCLKSR